MDSERRLSAIMFADIVGYTQLMAGDEKKAMLALRQFKDIALPIVEEYRGQWHKDLGDGALCSFGSAVEAIQGAIAIQKQLHAVADFKVRIGLHTGEVTLQAEDIFGDSVNVAARIQSAATPGEICISQRLYENVRNRDEFDIIRLGPVAMKGIAEPMILYRVPVTGGSAKAQPPRLHTPVEDRPLLLILPFDNLSSNGDTDFFSDGLTDELITDLSKIRSLHVVARNSSMKLKDSDEDVMAVARRMDVKFVLQGSVRKAASNLRISAQLVDVVRQTTIWAERYKGAPEDIFDFQEEVSRSIVSALDLKLSRREADLLSARPFTNLMAYEYYLRARRDIFSFREGSLHLAKENLEKGRALIGDNALILYGLGMVAFQEVNAGLSDNPEETLDLMASYGGELLAKDPGSHLGHTLSGLALAVSHANLLEAMPSFIEAYHSDPHNPDILVWLGVGLMSTGQLDISRKIVEELARIDPLEPLGHLLVGYNAFFRGDFQEALPHLERSLEVDAEVTVSLWCAVRLYAAADQLAEAHKHLKRLQALVPDSPFTESARLFLAAIDGDQGVLSQPLSENLRQWAARDGEWGQILVDTYALAGMKDEALHWLETCSKAGFVNHPFLAHHDPFLSQVRNDPKFSKKLEELYGVWFDFNGRVEALMAEGSP